MRRKVLDARWHIARAAPGLSQILPALRGRAHLERCHLEHVPAAYVGETIALWNT